MQCFWKDGLVLVAQLCPTLCDPYGLQPTRLLCPWDAPDKNPGVGCHSLLQGIFWTKELNPDLLHCRWILYELSYQGFPCGSAGKESSCHSGDLGFISQLGRSPGLENSMDCIVHGVSKSWTQLSNFHSLTHSLSVTKMVSTLKKVSTNSWIFIWWL